MKEKGMSKKKKTYKFEDLYIMFDIQYTLESDRNRFPSFTIISKSIDSALKKAKSELTTLVSEEEKPIITSIEFMDYVNKNGDVLCLDRNGEMWELMEDPEQEDKIIKEDDKPIDRSCWYINPMDVTKRVFNENGDVVELNTKQTDDDYEYFKSLKLNQDNVEREFGTIRYTTVCPMMYECIVYGHNFRYGYIKDTTTSLTEAILCVRIQFTKMYKNDDPRKVRK